MRIEKLQVAYQRDRNLQGTGTVTLSYVVHNTGKVLGIEVLCAAQGLDLGEPLQPGRGVAAAYAAVRARVRGLEGDRYLAPDLAAAERLVLDGELVAAVERAVGPLAL